MKHFIVIWYVVSSYITGPTLEPDPYTGEYPNMVNAVAVYRTNRGFKTKEFTTKSEAEKFIKDAPDCMKEKMKLVELEE